jgi:hypothetical protein
MIERGVNPYVTVNFEQDPPAEPSGRLRWTRRRRPASLGPPHGYDISAKLGNGRYFADCRAAVESQAGELLAAIRAGRVELSHIVGEIGAVYEGDLAGRSGEDEITIYKSLGTAAQDLATAHAVWRRVSGHASIEP